jgi:hypothetical protein
MIRLEAVQHEVKTCFAESTPLSIILQAGREGEVEGKLDWTPAIRRSTMRSTYLPDRA